MDILVHIPDDIARRLGTPGEVERRALEALAAEEYWRGHLSEPDVRRLLGFESGVTLGQWLEMHGEPRTPVTPDEASRARAHRAADNIIARRKGITLGGLKIKDLIDEGRP